MFHIVTDIDASVAFYRDTLGLTLESLSEDGGWAEFAVPPTTLGIDAHPHESSTPGGGGAGVALAVDDVETATDELQNEGVIVLVDPFDTGVCHVAVIADPDDNQSVLHRRNDGTYGRVNPFPRVLGEGSGVVCD